MKTRTIVILIVISIIVVAAWYYFTKNSPGYIESGNKQFRSLTKHGQCDVCYYATGDSSKHSVTYCPTCDAWICDKCQPNLPLRAIAMANRKLQIL